ncbi:hypothetical protein [Nocardiopsis nanhaiensis]
MSETARPHLCGATLLCPECLEQVRNLPPTDSARRYDTPDFSHLDGSTLCPVSGNDPGSHRGGRRPADPVAFLPSTVLTRP